MTDLSPIATVVVFMVCSVTVTAAVTWAFYDAVVEPWLLKRAARVWRRGAGYVGWVRGEEYYSRSGFIWYRADDRTQARLNVTLALSEQIDRSESNRRAAERDWREVYEEDE